MIVQLQQASLQLDANPALKDVSLTLQPAEILAVLGPNGAGKSSLLGVLAAELKPDSGALALFGQAAEQWPRQELARRLAVLPQFSRLSFPYSVEEVVLLGRMPHASGQRTDTTIVDQLLHKLDLTALRNRFYTQLSGGEKQRVQLARVFCQIWPEGDAPAARCLLLDEPTAALDLHHRKQVLDLIAELANSGCSVVMVLHDFNLAANYAQRIVVLKQGRVASCGIPEQVLSRELIRDVFQCDSHIMSHPGTGKPIVISE